MSSCRLYFLNIAVKIIEQFSIKRIIEQFALLAHIPVLIFFIRCLLMKKTPATKINKKTPKALATITAIPLVLDPE